MQTLRHSVLFLLAFSFAIRVPPTVAQTLIDTISVGSNGNPFYIAVDPVTNKIYVPIENYNTAWVIDGATDSALPFVVGWNHTAVGVNTLTNTIYMSQPNSSSVTVIDGTTLSAQAVPAGADAWNVAVNPRTNKIYVANFNGNSVTVIDGASLYTTTVPAGYYSDKVAINPVTNKIYVTNYGSNSVTAIDGANLSTHTVPVGNSPDHLAVNPVTNKIYVVNDADNDVAVIDGVTLSTTYIPVGRDPSAVAVDAVTNRIYVANLLDADVMVIDGTTNLVTATVPVGSYPEDIEIDAVTNKIYVVNSVSDSVTVIDGVTNFTSSPISVGNNPAQAAVNPATNRIYVTNQNSQTVSVIAGATNPIPLQFVPVPPCRLVDTRPQYGGSGPIQGGTSQNFSVPQEGSCNIPTSAAAYSLNVTIIPHGTLGYLSIWPTGEDQPVVSTMNSLDGRVKADAVIVPGGYQGAISVYVTNTADMALDIDGYFAPVSGSTLAFYPLTPCRVADTRQSNFPPGLGLPSLLHGQPRDFPVLNSPCIPSGVNAQAYSFNFTVVPGGHPVGYLSVWPTGQSQPVVSTLNDQTGTIVANAAIVPAGTGGDITVYSTDNTQLLIDIDGYFAPAGHGGLSLYPAAPCRVLDTRQGQGAFSGELTVDVLNSVCAPPSQAQAYVFNATVAPVGSLGFLTLWPDGSSQPIVSTLNALDGAVTNNMAIVPAGNQGKVDAYAGNGLTQLILDISSYFAP